MQKNNGNGLPDKLENKLWSAADVEDDGEPFEEKMARLTATLQEQFAESARLEAIIKKNLAKLGYDE